MGLRLSQEQLVSTHIFKTLQTSGVRPVLCMIGETSDDYMECRVHIDSDGKIVFKSLLTDGIFSPPLVIPGEDEKDIVYFEANVNYETLFEESKDCKVPDSKIVLYLNNVFAPPHAEYFYIIALSYFLKRNPKFYTYLLRCDREGIPYPDYRIYKMYNSTAGFDEDSSYRSGIDIEEMPLELRKMLYLYMEYVSHDDS